MTPSLATLLNAPTDVEFEGKVYKLRQPTLLECGEYQRHIEAEARAGAARATELPDEDRRQLLRDVVADIAAKAYRWGGLVCARSLQTVAGNAKLMSIICRDQGMTEEIAERLCEHKFRECVAIMAAAEAGDDPKARAAIPALLASLGLPQTFLSTSSSLFATGPTAPPPTPPGSDASAPAS